MNTKKLIISAFVLSLVAVTFPSSNKEADAYVLPGRKWQNPSNVVYKINPTNAQGLSESGLIEAIKNGADQWKTQGQTQLQFVYGGTTTSGGTFTADYTNNVFFRPASSQYGYAAAEAYWWYDGTGYLIDFDIAFYDQAGYSWYLPGQTCSAPGLYLNQTAVHEFGHAVAISHSDVGTATMRPYVSYCETTDIELDPDDIAAIRAIYPMSGTNPPPPPGVANINVSPTSLSFSANTGVTPSGKNLNISNSGTATLNWSASTNQSWCRVSPTSGSIAVGSNANTVVGVDSLSSAGTFSCTVTVSGQADNSPRIVGVNYTVTNVAPPPTGETNPPTVTLTSPTAGGTVAKKGSVTITANATDDTGVTKVLFYVGTTLTCTDTSAPYSCNWKVPASPNKAYSLQAKGYDAAGNIGTSNTVNVVAK